MLVDVPEYVEHSKGAPCPGSPLLLTAHLIAQHSLRYHSRAWLEWQAAASASMELPAALCAVSHEAPAAAETTPPALCRAYLFHSLPPQRPALCHMWLRQRNQDLEPQAPPERQGA